MKGKCLWYSLVQTCPFCLPSVGHPGSWEAGGNGVCVLAGVPSLTPSLPPVFSSIYKDSNTLHLPTERFSPVRRFSDGAASIQAFKAHLEKMGNNSSIKQLQQVREGWGSSQQPPQGIPQEFLHRNPSRNSYCLSLAASGSKRGIFTRKAEGHSFCPCFAAQGLFLPCVAAANPECPLDV